MLEKINILDHGRYEEKVKILKNIFISVGLSIFLFAITFVLYLNFSKGCWFGLILKSWWSILLSDSSSVVLHGS